MGYIAESLKLRFESREQLLEIAKGKWDNATNQIAKTYWCGVYDERRDEVEYLSRIIDIEDD